MDPTDEETRELHYGELRPTPQGTLNIIHAESPSRGMAVGVLLVGLWVGGVLDVEGGVFGALIVFGEAVREWRLPWKKD